MDDTGTRSSEPLERGEASFRRGTNQSGMRDYNERLVLSLVRQHGSLAKRDIARMTGLSAQTISVIMRKLEADELLVREAPVRGKVGQPSIPMSLNPHGAYFLGLKIGRRSADLVLIDFLGTLRAIRHLAYGYPAPRETVDFVLRGIEEFRAGLTPSQDKRVAGIGIAMPFELWNWADAVGASRQVMDEWRHADIRADIAARLPFPVYLQNDATSACGAELVFGDAGELRDFVYFYIGAFVGGGVVLNGSLYAGRTGNAGALGSMPVPGSDGWPRQLIDIASVATLERVLIAKHKDASVLWTSPQDWGDLGEDLDLWIDNAAQALAYSTAAASSVIEFEAAIIDGWVPRAVLERICQAAALHIGKLDVEGIKIPVIRKGTVGLHARAIGGASLPLSERFLVGAAAHSRYG